MKGLQWLLPPPLHFQYNIYVAEILLQTKLFAPPLRPLAIARPHLIHKLNTGLNGKLTLVSAPAGFGKTTLVSGWLQECGRPFAWLSLDKDDNEPNRFLTYLLSALQKIEGKVGQTAVSLLQSSQTPPAETILALLINDLASLSQPIILVLDDYHAIHSLDIHKALTFFLDNLPPQLHLAITSREDPPLPLHRLRSRGLMNGVYAHDLRFAPNEATEFLQQTMNVHLAAEDVAQLARRTEGWIAGLQLAALSLQGLPDAHEFVADFAGDDRFISDYLLHEVIERQPTDIQEFLLKTAVLDRFCPSLCAAILQTSINHAQAILTHLEEINLFIIPLDNKRQWYRYHHLFADFLRIGLPQPVGYQQGELHQRAAIWFEENGLLIEAVTHCLAAQDFQRAARLIETMTTTISWVRGNWTSLQQWLEALPDSILYRRPQLFLTYAWALHITNQREKVLQLLPQVEQVVQAMPETAVRQNMLGEIAVIRANIAYQKGYAHQCIVLAQEALTLLAPDNHSVRGGVLYALGQAYTVQDDGPAAAEAFQAAIATGQMLEDKAIALVSTGSLMKLLIRQGQLRQAAALYQQAKQLEKGGKGDILGPSGAVYVVMSELWREWNELEAARQILSEGLKLCQQQGNMPILVLEGMLTLARILLAMGDEMTAIETMQQAEQRLQVLQERSDHMQTLIGLVVEYGSHFWLAQGNLAAAAHWLLQKNGTAKSVDGDDELHLARLCLAQNRLEEAAAHLQQIGLIVDAQTAVRPLVEYHLLQALVNQARGQQQQAIAWLSEALSLAEPEGFVRLFVDEGEPMVRLLQTAVQQNITPSYTQKLLSAFDQLPTPPSPDLSATLIESLNEREQQTLKLMAAGLSNREIAEELYLSVNTIKVYTSRIYGKLGVTNRAEAVNQAHELGLL